MSGRNPIDSLRRLASVTDAEAAGAFGEASREELLALVTGLPLGNAPRRPATRRPRRRLIVAFAALALIAVATAGTWAALQGSAHETTSVQCLIGGSDTIVPATSGDPAQDCAADYRRETGTSAPQLVAYDNGLGGVTVIPRGAKPQAGWVRLVSGQDVDLIQLQDSLDDYVNGLNSTCMDGAAATSFTRSKLAQFGFTGWTISVRSAEASSNGGPGPAKNAAATENTSDTRTCVASDIVDPSAQTVTLIPVAIGTAQTPFEKLAAELQPLTRSCRTLPAAVASVRAAANTLGLSESDRQYDLNAVKDDSLRCASIYETVGGTIFLTVRGPGG